MSIKTFMRSPGRTLDIRDHLTDAAREVRLDPAACVLVQDRGALVGALTPADVNAAGPSTLPALAAYEHASLTERLTVAHALAGEAIVVPLEAPLADAARALRAAPQRAALVTDGADVVGVLTAEDLLDAVIERLERDGASGLARVLVAVSQPASPAAPGSRSALQVALRIARLHDATLTVVHVMRRLSPAIAEGLSAGIDADVHRWRLAEARTSLGRLIGDADGLAVRTDIRAGDVVDGVLAAAAGTSADLIVVGGRPGSMLARAVIRRSPCPVLVV